MEVGLIGYTHGGDTRFCVWHLEGDDDLCGEDGKIFSFSGEAAARAYITKNSLTLCELDELPACNLDWLYRWIQSEDTEIDCDEMLRFWNLFGDAATTTGQPFLGEVGDELTDLLYDKLFAGCNLPAIKPEEEPDYVPVWDAPEIARIKAIMMNGSEIFLNNLVRPPE